MPRKPKPGVEQATFQRNARKYAKDAIKVLAEAMKSPDSRVRVAAATRILEYAHGRPSSQATPEGDPSTVHLIKGDDKL